MTPRRAVTLAAAAVLVVGVTAAWKLQHDFDAHQKALLARAVVSPEQARQAALALFPGGTIVEAEIEEENGRLIHSFEIEVPGQAGIWEVEVDAMTGEVLPPELDDEDGDDGDEDEDDDDDEDDEVRGRAR